MTKKIGTPRPPKDRAIKFQYGRWEEVCQPSKALEKRRVQQEIEEGVELYYTLIEDDLDDECGGWENR